MKNFCIHGSAAIVVFTSCFFNADAPLHNDPPTCLDMSDASMLLDSLRYPDSSLCTLNITDRNDTSFSLSILRCTDSANSACLDSQQESPWPGSYEFLTTGFDVKKLLLFFPTNRMGTYLGTLLLRDDAGAKLLIPYTIQKIFFDPFDTFPIQSRYWRSYKEGDTANLTFDLTDKKLMFSFKKNPDSPMNALSTGIRSVFQVQDSFEITVNFKLRDEMNEGFEIGFFVSSSPDTGKLTGKKAGIFISGFNQKIRMECRSIFLQNNNFDTNAVSGTIGISRSDSTVTYFVRDGKSVKNPLARIQHFFPRGIPVYIHLKMTESDQLKDRHCYWNDLVINKGDLIF